MNEVVLIRHAEVEPAWKSICYGALDVPLSAPGIQASRCCAEQIDARVAPARIYHSGLGRTEQLAGLIAERFPGVSLVSDPRLRERNYGRWQGLTWDAAYGSDPEHFHDLIDQPDTYRPPDGETTSEMQRRVVQWYQEITASPFYGRIIAVSHSGPIAALAGHLVGAAANQWQPWMLRYLESICISDGQLPRISQRA